MDIFPGTADILGGTDPGSEPGPSNPRPRLEASVHPPVQERAHPGVAAEDPGPTNHFDFAGLEFFYFTFLNRAYLNLSPDGKASIFFLTPMLAAARTPRLKHSSQISD